MEKYPEQKIGKSTKYSGVIIFTGQFNQKIQIRIHL